MDDLVTAEAAAEWIAVPGPEDDKYSRGVLGFVTGSAHYPGAAVLGVDAALHTGVGMVRYLGPGRPTRLVLQHRPETVTADGRVQAWVLGSGQDAAERDDLTAFSLETALGQRVPILLDAGALALHGSATGPVLLAPHARELSRLLDLDPDAVRADPAAIARSAARDLRATVLLKGHTTHVATPDGVVLAVRSAPTWLATAGAGDALAGIIGALLATHSERVLADPLLLGPIAAAGAVIHGRAAERAGGGGPFTILDLCAAIPATIVDLLHLTA